MLSFDPKIIKSYAVPVGTEVIDGISAAFIAYTLADMVSTPRVRTVYYTEAVVDTRDSGEGILFLGHAFRLVFVLGRSSFCGGNRRYSR